MCLCVPTLCPVFFFFSSSFLSVTLFLQNNELDGSLNPVCAAEPEHLTFLIADCDSEVECDCCESCCVSTDLQCANNDGIMDTLNEKPSRDNYLFSENIIIRDISLHG